MKPVSVNAPAHPGGAPINRRRGLTILEVIVIVAVLALLVGILMPAIGSPPRRGHRQLRDSSQIRGVIQGLVVWAGNNRDLYPLPSLIDAENHTVADQGTAKDTTANIMSILIHNTLVPTEMLVSPAESNSEIKVMQDYQHSRPKAAVNPEKALWDPAFKADFTNHQEGYLSYAHALPMRSLGIWSNTINATEAVVGNRGPQIASVTYDKSGSPTPVYTLKDSNTLLIHGSRNKWEGNIGFNDNHVDFFNDTSSELYTYRLPGGNERRDIFFYDEPDASDAPDSKNAYLTINTRAGDRRSDFQSIWD